MFKRSIATAIFAAATVAGTASAHSTAGDGETLPVTTFEDGSTVLVEGIGTFGLFRVSTDADTGRIKFLVTFEDGSFGPLFHAQ